jgi:hypothetical protein
MVCAAVRAFGGVRAPSLARPMLQSANDAFLSGHTITAAVCLREALRRFLVAECASSRLDQEGTPEALVERLRGSGVTVSSLIADALVECEDILTLRARGKYFAFTLECAFQLIGSDNRKGGAL